MKEWTIDKYRFVMTTPVCPEQYHVYNISEDLGGYGHPQVAYVRLRWGTLCIHIPNAQAPCIPVKTYEDPYKGCFDSDEERFEAFMEIVSVLDSLNTGEVR